MIKIKKKLLEKREKKNIKNLNFNFFVKLQCEDGIVLQRERHHEMLQNLEFIVLLEKRFRWRLKTELIQK